MCVDGEWHHSILDRLDKLVLDLVVLTTPYLSCCFTAKTTNRHKIAVLLNVYFNNNDRWSYRLANSIVFYRIYF